MTLCVAAAAIVVTPPVAFWAAVWWLPDAPTVSGRSVAAATLFLDRRGDELTLLASAAGDLHLPVIDAGRWLGDAVVAVEDHRFAEHAGVDWHAAVAAAWDDLVHLRVRRGASTIPMQVIRLRDPAPRSLLGKATQAVRATQLMRVASRGAVILEYLNRAPFGGNLVGVGAASRHYFAKRPDELTLAEAATLAGLPQNPNGLRPDRFPARATVRRNVVLDRMLACGKITADAHAAAVAEPLVVRTRPLPQNVAGSPAATLLPTLARLTTRDGGVVWTTFDADVQRTAATLLRDHLTPLSAGQADLAAAAVVLDTQTGECLAAVSAGPAAGKMDLTVRRRSTGSTLKPFIYAAAFADGLCGPGTLLTDAPRTWTGYAPRNMDRAFGGRLTAAQALAQSRNLPAMELLSLVGVGRVAGVLNALGVRVDDPHRYGLTLAVGGVEASPMDVAGAFATLGRGGMAKRASFGFPQPVRREKARFCLTDQVQAFVGSDATAQAVDSASRSSTEAKNPRLAPWRVESDLIRQTRPRETFCENASRVGRRQAPSLALPREYTGEGTRILASIACEQVLRALSDEERTAAVCPDAKRLRPAWKTGTSSGQRDAWCAAVTSERTVVVWIGDPASHGDSTLVGVETAAPVALRLLTAVSPAWAGREAEAAASADDVAGVLPVSVPRLSIVSPTADQQVVFDPSTPAARQRVRLRATGGRVFWFIDAEPLTAADGDAWWSPTPGTHTLRAVAASGEAAAVRVTVTTME